MGTEWFNQIKESGNIVVGTGQKIASISMQCKVGEISLKDFLFQINKLIGSLKSSANHIEGQVSDLMKEKSKEKN